MSLFYLNGTRYYMSPVSRHLFDAGSVQRAIRQSRLLSNMYIIRLMNPVISYCIIILIINC